MNPVSRYKCEIRCLGHRCRSSLTEGPNCIESPLPTATPIIIEFAGLPAAGKSVAASAVIDALHRRGVRCPPLAALTRCYRAVGLEVTDRDRGLPGPLRSLLRLLRLGWSAGRYPGMAVDLARFARKVRREMAAGGTVPVHMLSKAMVLRACRRIRSQEVIILDQGLLQAAFSAVIRRPGLDRAAVERLLIRLVDQLDIHIVWFDLPPATALQRSTSRSAHLPRHQRGALVDRLEAEQALRLMTDALEPCEQWVAALAQRMRGRLLRVDACVPSAAVAERVLAHVDQVLAVPHK